MNFWIATLRMTGLGLLGLVVAGTAILLTNLQTFTLSSAYTFILTIVIGLAVALICLGTAVALDTLRTIEQRTVRRRQLPPNDNRRDLAPHAPTNWVEFKKRPVDPEREKDAGYYQRLARRRR